MNGIFWILAGAMTGWLTGELIGEKGYGKPLFGRYVRSLDIFLGVGGATLGDHLFIWAVVGSGSSFSRYATAILGSLTLVGVARLVSARFFPSPSYKGMSRRAFIKWQDTLAVKELASWHPRARKSSGKPADC